MKRGEHENRGKWRGYVGMDNQMDAGEVGKERIMKERRNRRNCPIQCKKETKYMTDRMIHILGHILR